MKYLKKYEDINKYDGYRKFWLISIENKLIFNLSLELIGIPKDANIYNFFDFFKDNVDINEVYIAINQAVGYDHPVYEWNKGNKNGYDNFDLSGYEYMGKIEVPQELVDQEKFNL